MDEISTLPPLGDIPLLLAESEQGMERSPSGVPVGLIVLQAWQVSLVPHMPEGLDEYAAYLIRIAYDLDIEPTMPTLEWFEVGFEFAAAPAIVHDAVPQYVDRCDEPRAYVLNGQLTFTRQDHEVAGWLMPDIQLPAVAPEIQLLGRGSSQVRWQHIGTADAPIRAGSHTGWIVLLVPMEQCQVPVCATARFALPATQDTGLREVDQPDAFTIDLPGQQPVSAHRVTAGGPRVFVSYAHDSHQHQQAVKALCDLLKEAGVNIVLDQNEPAVRLDWHRWMTIGITRSDYIIVIASPAYRSVGLFEFDDHTHSGAQDEYRLLASMLGESRGTWPRKILPVVLPGRAASEIPLGLRLYDAGHYIVPSLDADGIADLVQAINHGRPAM